MAQKYGRVKFLTNFKSGGEGSAGLGTIPKNTNIFSASLKRHVFDLIFNEMHVIAKIKRAETLFLISEISSSQLYNLRPLTTLVVVRIHIIELSRIAIESN